MKKIHLSVNGEMRLVRNKHPYSVNTFGLRTGDVLTAQLIASDNYYIVFQSAEGRILELKYIEF